jgi:ABC-type antimicrobial peptide transport system permease subunit
MISTDTYPAQSVVSHPVRLRVCGAIVGAAIAVPPALMLVRVVAGPDVSIGTASFLTFVALLLGARAGLVAVQRILKAPKAHAGQHVAAVYALTFIAVPSLLYALAAAVVLAAFSTYH